MASRNTFTALVSQSATPVVPDALLSRVRTDELLSPGRTARIGNEGIATSFYNERDEELAPELVKILLECKQEVPDFLEPFAPVDNNDETRDQAEEETIVIEAGTPQNGQPEPGFEQPAPASDDQWTDGGANSQGIGESQWAPAGNDSW